jgi:hypothetical protein
MSSPMLTTQSGDPTVFLAPDFQQASLASLVANSPALDALQAQLNALQTQVTANANAIAALDTRVTALENAATQAPPA